MGFRTHTGLNEHCTPSIGTGGGGGGSAVPLRATRIMYRSADMVNAIVQPTMERTLQAKGSLVKSLY